MLPRFPNDMPAVGYSRGLWGHVRSNISYLLHQRDWIKEGYIKYGKRGLPFLVPAGLSRPPDVVLPRSMLPWLLEQPESAVDAHAAHNEIIYGDYNFLVPSVVRDSFGSRAITKWLNRSLPGLIPAIEAEVRHAVERALAHVGADWTSVKLWDFWLAIVPPVTNRILAGADICRDERYLDAVVSFTHAVLRNCILLRMCPAVLHPVVGRLLAMANWRDWRRADKLLRPIVEQRVEDMTSKARDWQPPEDLITWLIRQALAEGRTGELDPEIISMRLLPLEFASIDTTVLTGLLWTLDLLSSSPSVLATLTGELHAHQPAPGSPWSKAALLSLVRVDSSIRESQRLSNFHSTLIERVIIPSGGLRLHVPGHDWILPRGAHLTVNLDGLHHDEDVYDDARTYDALRFSRIRESRGERCSDTDAGTGVGGATLPLGMVSMNDTHFSFGHGRFICPGRFFVAHELRLIAAELLLKYEFKMLNEPPRRRWIGSGMVPPFRARIEIRRKRPANS
ncbi:cytochrome p450 [Hirsutella rhossiliensis]|uniref:Cytochrome p450 domain-containing protein n=1 Tax=Hirsutella rhossiliensis TaxID=111463 RepID=A0A9P8N0T0_9HYPO|nr:cytochrome p450 domain-containing protein [Hirsutella rhossiliensis]KAH0964755.1 cytochrome p450 domain-containing protein [Hirsutella rhossiliensis]